MKKRCFEINADGIFTKIVDPVLKAKDVEILSKKQKVPSKFTLNDFILIIG